MLFKRVISGGSPLKGNDVGDINKKVMCESNECTSDRSSETCEQCLEIRIIEVMQIVLLSLILWAGITYGGVVLPFSNNLIPAGVMYPPPEYDYPFPSSSILKRLPKIKPKHLNDSLQFAENSINALKHLETNLEKSEIHTKLNTPEHGQWIVGYPSNDVSDLNKLSLAVTKASTFLSYAHCGRFGISEEECASYISTISLKNTDTGKVCSAFHQAPCTGLKKYRSEDGSCNNLKRKSWGQSHSGFKRILHPRYADGISKPRESKNKNSLPPPRSISSSIATDLNAPDSKYTLAFMQWTQFVEHDLVHVPIQKMIHNKNSISCCDRFGGDLSPRHQHPSCYPMSVSRSDLFYGDHWVSCLPYTRSATTFRGDCSFGAAEQMNQATHFLDGSNIYGSNVLNAKSLREYKGGLMKVEEDVHGAFLPLVEKSKRKEMCQVGETDDTCFKSGDVRVNMHPHLATMHTIWLREHNRIAKSLSLLNPTWSDELLYQEARRIVIAQLQHITYEHWLPKIIGKGYNEKLEPYDTGYDPETDPSISNSVATAGMRFVNSLLDGTLDLIEEDGTLNETYELVDHFNRPHIVKSPGKFDKLVRGLISQRSQSMDLHFPDDVTQQLYSPRDKKLGLDILSFDIQRGRDHGIPPYYLFREICNLNPGNEFEDFQDTIPEKNIQQLKRLYNHPHDVDLIVGALAEQPESGKFLGPVFTCLLREQFHRTKSGDRYFYTNVEQPAPFTHQQLEQIRKTSLSRIICDNVPEISEIPKNVFEISDSRSDYVSCNGGNIKRMNLAAWQDPVHKPNLLVRTKKIITTSF